MQMQQARSEQLLTVFKHQYIYALQFYCELKRSGFEQLMSFPILTKQIILPADQLSHYALQAGKPPNPEQCAILEDQGEK